MKERDQQKKVRGKAKPLTAKDAELVDRMIHKWLTQGIQVLDSATAQPIRDETGKYVRREISAAHLESVRKWLQYREESMRRGMPFAAGLLAEADRRIADGRIKFDPNASLDGEGVRLKIGGVE